jgi:hypothetical protein
LMSQIKSLFYFQFNWIKFLFLFLI